VFSFLVIQQHSLTHVRIRTHTGTDTISETYCESLIATLNNTDHLPKACQRYESVVKKLEQKIARTFDKANDPYAGMTPAATLAAKSTRRQGRESHAQIQRRYTSTGRRFSKLDK